MNIIFNRKEIKHLLDKSADRVDRSIVDGLQAARQHALQHQRTSISTSIGRNGLLHGHLQLTQRSLGWITAAIVVTLLLANVTCRFQASEHERGDIDIAILTDDMPVDVYVD